MQVVVATGQGNLAYLEVQQGKLNQVAHHKLEVEVACVDITPIGETLLQLPMYQPVLAVRLPNLSDAMIAEWACGLLCAVCMSENGHPS